MRFDSDGVSVLCPVEQAGRTSRFYLPADADVDSHYVILQEVTNEI